MSHDNPQSENRRSENGRAESARRERSRSEKSATGLNAPFGGMGAGNFAEGLRLQKEMFELLQEVGREWVSRANSEAELALRLPNRLTAAESLPAAVSAYQEWLGEWMSLCGNDGRQLLADSRRIIDRGVRCFASARPS
jgi:hypothetical protein